MTASHIDWLRHDLTITGPTEPIRKFQQAASGPGGIPWHYPDLDLVEEDQVHALIGPPDFSPGLRPAAARTLARQLRHAVETHHQRVLAAEHSHACPLSLHALLPIPPALLRRGPNDPDTIAWRQTHWGTLHALRHPRLRAGASQRAARLDYEFWSADWSPWPALASLRTLWPTLVFDLRPDYRDA